MRAVKKVFAQRGILVLEIFWVELENKIFIISYVIEIFNFKNLFGVVRK